MNGPKIRRLYYSTREVSEVVHIEPNELRAWEKRFSVLRPVKSKSGRRLYKPSAVKLAKRIKYLKDQGVDDSRIDIIIGNHSDEETRQPIKQDPAMERSVPVHEIIDTLKEIITILDGRGV